MTYPVLAYVLLGLGVVCGFLVLPRYKKSKGLKGRGMAIAGIVIGLAALAYALVSLIILAIYYI